MTLNSILGAYMEDRGLSDEYGARCLLRDSIGYDEEEKYDWDKYSETDWDCE